MKFNGRLLVGLNGHEPDPLLIRYASMVARLNSCMPLAKRAPRSNIGSSESVATANDAVVTYDYDTMGDRLTITDAAGCQVTYRRS